MTERGAGRLARDATHLAIGPSALRVEGDALVVDIDERSAPWRQRVHGRIRVVPEHVFDTSLALDAAARHRWTPIAPCARVEIDLSHPASRWRGHAYLDSNAGDAPLEADFARWDWSRARGESGDSIVFYDVERRDRSRREIALRFDPRSGTVDEVAAPAPIELARSRWGLGRTTRGDAPQAARVVRSLEDGPFYARSLVASTLLGRPALAVHESLDLRRFAAPWVQALLPFRMPRRR